MSSQSKNRESTLLVKLSRLVGSGAVAGVLVAAVALPAVGSVGVITRDAANGFRGLPAELDTGPMSQRSVVKAADGSNVATFYNENRVVVPLHKVSKVMQQAIIAIEDERFYEHGPFDPQGTLRALITNTQTGEVRQGGSTLTQQYVKNMLIDAARTEEERKKAQAPTFARKLRELRYAVNVEKDLTKKEILQGYLNVSYYGEGAYGVEAAAKRYFSKPAKKLRVHEAAMLAGLVQNPSAYDPLRNEGAAKRRRNVVIDRMVQVGSISQAQAAEAKQQDLDTDPKEAKGGCELSSAPFFCEYVRHEILNNEEFGETRKDREMLLQRGGLTIETTLDPQAQQASQDALENRVSPTNQRAAAQAMVEPGTGNIKAVAVSKKFGPKKKKGATSINFAANTAHGGGVGVQAGSTFKAFTLAAALKKGVSPSQSFPGPSSTTLSGYEDCDGNRLGSWTLSNSSEGGGGSYDLRSGTHNSVNTFYANLERQIGVCAAVKMAESLGMKRANGKPLSEVPAFTLGIDEIDPVSLANAFASFGARGKYCEPIAITKITDAQGKELEVPERDCEQVLDKKVADQVNSILQGVIKGGTAEGLGIGRPAAGKTGTTENFSGAMFAGYTPDLASAVWYGDPRGGFQHPVYGVYGATIPGPIWQQSMRNALSGTPSTSFGTQVSAPDDGSDDENTGDTEVPNVNGAPVSLARSRLRAAGFEVNVSSQRVRSEYPRGTVARTTPSGGRSADRGDTVTIIVSQGGSPGGGDNGNGFPSG